MCLCVSHKLHLNKSLFILSPQAFLVDYRLVFALTQHAIICLEIHLLFAVAGAIDHGRYIETTFGVHSVCVPM